MLRWLIDNLPDILLEHGIQQIHVVRLSLDCVGEETIGFVGDQKVYWNLYDFNNISYIFIFAQLISLKY